MVWSLFLSLSADGTVLIGDDVAAAETMCTLAFTTTSHSSPHSVESATVGVMVASIEWVGGLEK